MSFPQDIKVVLLGEPGVGKTCILTRFILDEFNENILSSTSAQYLSKQVDFTDNNESLLFQVWDTAGQERFHSLAKLFYRNAKVICLVYDITCKTSFEKLKSYWYENEVKKNVEGNPIIAVIGNKFDLYESRKVKEEKVLEFVKSINAIFQYTSAKNSSGIEELFEKIGKKYFNPDINIIDEENKERELYEQKKRQKGQKNNDNKVKLENPPSGKKKKKCC